MSNLILNEKYNISESGHYSFINSVVSNIEGFKSHKEYLTIFFKESPLRVLYVNLEKGLFLSFKENELNVYKYDKKNLMSILKDLKIKMDKEDLYNYCEGAISKLKILERSLKKSSFSSLIKGEKIIKEGDFLYTSWGYDQTNTEYFKVLRIIGKNYFIIREVSQYQDPDKETQMTYYNVLPTEKFIDLPIKAFISNDGYMSICENGYKRSLYKWDGESKYKTNTQFGH